MFFKKGRESINLERLRKACQAEGKACGEGMPMWAPWLTASSPSSNAAEIRFLVSAPLVIKLLFCSGKSS